jgi:hypothetical protein
MSNRYTVAPGQMFNYPADLISQQIVKSSGGRSKLSDEDKLRVKFKTVTEGQDCSDMPKDILDLYTERGWVIKSESESGFRDFGTGTTVVTHGKEEITHG